MGCSTSQPEVAVAPSPAKPAVKADAAAPEQAAGAKPPVVAPKSDNEEHKKVCIPGSSMQKAQRGMMLIERSRSLWQSR